MAWGLRALQRLFWRARPCFSSRRAEVIKTKGLEKITIDDLVAEITPYGRGASARHCPLCLHVDGHSVVHVGVCAARVPEEVRDALLERVKTFMNA